MKKVVERTCYYRNLIQDRLKREKQNGCFVYPIQLSFEKKISRIGELKVQS